MGSFPQELDSAWRKRRKELGRELIEEEGKQLEGELFEQWVANRRFDELIRRVHHEYSVEGGLHELIVLGYALREAKDIERIQTLFCGLLKRRTKAFGESWKHAKDGHVGHMLLAARRMASCMEVYLEYFHSLQAVGSDEQAEQVRLDMLALQAREKLRSTARTSCK